MGFVIEPDNIDRIAALDVVRQAAQAGGELISLWPLTDAKQMDNDAKYGENLQVRVTRMIAAIVTGQEVTVPDAEFVYEGADEIPGRPQEIVDALLAANDAYDAVADYSETGDIRLPLAAASELDVDWDGATIDAMTEALQSIERLVGVSADESGRVPASADPAEVARRFALVLLAVDGLLEVLDAGKGRSLADTMPLVLFANELCERLGVPRLCPDVTGWQAIVQAHAEARNEQASHDAQQLESTEAIAMIVAPLAADEWTKHREDVLWDPVEAKKRAQEEDERKSKAALAAKFAHVKDDPNKETVEL